MHVLDITMFYAPDGGGVSSYLNAKAAWLKRHGMRHTIASTGVAACCTPAGVVAVPGFAVPGINGYRWPLASQAVLRLARRHRPHLIEVGDAGPFALAALEARRRLGMPLVAFCHSDLQALVGERCGPAAAALSRRYLARLYRRYDLVLAPSHYMAQRLQAAGIAAVQQPLGVDTAVFRPLARPAQGRAGLRACLGLAPGTRLLLYAGRFTPQKKLHLLIAAVARLGEPYHLLLIGSGHVLPPAERCTVLPFERDPHRLAGLLGGCDLLVHPADTETFGLIALEAMACGLPVLGTGGGVAELIDEKVGRVVCPDSVTALVAGVDALFACDLAQLGRQARSKACLHYDWTAIMPQLLGRYRRLLMPASCQSVLAEERHDVDDGSPR